MQGAESYKSQRFRSPPCKTRKQRRVAAERRIHKNNAARKSVRAQRVRLELFVKLATRVRYHAATTQQPLKDSRCRVSAIIAWNPSHRGFAVAFRFVCANGRRRRAESSRVKITNRIETSNKSPPLIESAIAPTTQAASGYHTPRKFNNTRSSTPLPPAHRPWLPT